MSGTEIIVIIAVGAVASLVKSTTGMGYPLVLLPALALFIGVAEAVVIVAPANLLLNVRQIYKLRSHRSGAATLPRFLMGASVGSLVGTSLLSFVPDRALRIVLVVVIVLFLINRLSSRSFTMSPEQGARWSSPVGLVAGLFQGATGISGPIVTPWFLSQNLVRETFIYVISVTFGLIGLLQIALLAAQGSFTPTLFTLGMVLIPVALLVFPLGAIIRDRISVEAFEQIVLVLLAAGAISLLVRVV